MRRIAINVGGGYVPGLNAVLAGAVLAARELGWSVTGIRDGFDGLLAGDGLVELTPELVENSVTILGNATRSDPFHVRRVNADNMVEEIDRSDELLEKVRAEKIDAAISVVGPGALGILFKLHRKGLRTVCVPKSVENDVAATQLSFGFNSALSFAVETLERARQAAQSTGKVGVVEVLGEHAGWLALQSGMAVCADAVLIPEIPYDIQKVAAKLRGKSHGLVVVAEGARPIAGKTAGKPNRMRAMLSPGSTGEQSSHVITRAGHAAETVAMELQRIANVQTYPLVLSQLVKAGPPTAVDRQLGLGYGAAAIRAINENQTGVMVAFVSPDLKFVPLAEAINQVRTVPATSVFVQIARSIGIALGD